MGSCYSRSMQLLAMAGAVSALSAAALAQPVIKLERSPNPGTTAKAPAPLATSAINTPEYQAQAKLNAGPNGGGGMNPRGIGAADNCGDAPTVGDGTYNFDLTAATNDYAGTCGA